MSSDPVKPTPEELLRKLLDGFSNRNDKGLIWKYLDGYSIEDIFGKEFHQQLIEYKDPDKN